MNSAIGECFCRKIKFEIKFPIGPVSHCHCESCRKSHGAAFVTWSWVLRNQFKFLTGENMIKKFSSSSPIDWCFCMECGSSLLYEHKNTPEIVYFTVANIIGKLDQWPSRHVSYEEQVPWFKFKDDLQKFKGKSDERITD